MWSHFLALLLLLTPFSAAEDHSSAENGLESRSEPLPRAIADPKGESKPFTPVSPEGQLKQWREEVNRLLEENPSDRDCVTRVCRRLAELKNEIDKLHRFGLQNKSEEEAKSYLDAVPTRELSSLLKSIERDIRIAETGAAKGVLDTYRKQVDELSAMRESVEKALFPPPLAQLRKDYRTKATKLNNQLKSASYQEKQRISDQLDEINKKKSYLDLISLSELEDLRATKPVTATKDPRAERFKSENPEWIEEAYDEVASRLPSGAREAFRDNFEPRITFGEEGETYIEFIPNKEFQKRQAEQRIALTTYETGNLDDQNIKMGRITPLTLPKNSEDSLRQLVGLVAIGKDKDPASSLVDRSELSSGGVRSTGDEFIVVAGLAGAGKKLAGEAFQILRNLGARQVARSAVQGAAFGGGFDIAQQAAENFDRFRKGERVKGYDPVRTLENAGIGAMLGPFAAGSPGVTKALGIAGLADGSLRAYQGDYASALVSGGGSLLAFRKPKSALGDVIAGDAHLAVKKDATGKIVLDTEHPSYRYLEGFVESIKADKDKIGKIILNGDYIDAPSLKAVGSTDPQTKARLIAQVVRYLETSTGKKVEIGLGNHDSVKNPETGGYEGELVARELKKIGINPFAENDTALAMLPLSQKVNGRPVFIELSHKVNNFGPILADLLPQGAQTRVLPDVISARNPQASTAIAARFSSDIHQPISIETLNANAQGSQRFQYANTGAVNGSVNSRLSLKGQPENAFEGGTYLFVTPTASGGASVEVRTLTPSASKIASGKLKPSDYSTIPDPKNPSESFDIGRVSEAARALPRDRKLLPPSSGGPIVPIDLRKNR